MNTKRMRLLTTICLFFISAIGIAQEKSPYKFGKVSVEDLQRKVYSIDSNASAVVLADVGSSEIVGNNKSSFSLIFKRYTRIHILNKNGYDAADVLVQLYESNGIEENLDNVKAVTYNLEGGKVQETKLEKSNIFKDKLDKNWFTKKFTLPNIKEGSIIEYQYEIKSDDIRNFQSWTFQGEHPVLWSEYNASIPEFFVYAFLSQGYRQFDIKNEKNRAEQYRISDTRGAGATETDVFSSGVTDYRWVIKNVPALKEESYTSTIKNHIQKIEFQMTAVTSPLRYQSMMGTWTDLAKTLLESEYFGQQINRDNNWLGDVVKPLITGAKNDLEKASRIYAYVRDNFTCTERNRLTTEQNLKNVLKGKKGNEAEINLLLTAMFKYAGLDSDPVILSTRSNGYTNPLYPLITRFNYVVSMAVIDNKPQYFDASVSRLGFGKLMPYCYNGHARVVNNEVPAIEFSPDSLNERKMSSLFMTSDDKGNLSGNMQQTMGYYESINTRDKIKESGKDELLKDLRKAYSDNVELSNITVESLDKPEENLALKYEMTFKNEGEDIIYFNPMVAEAYKQNPFKSAERFYPVEMPYNKDEHFILNIQVPKGYVVDELPKSMRMKMNEEGDGMFEYLIQQDGETISMRSRIMLKRTYYVPEEYEMLREFFNMIVKKQGEQIVFKKKK